MGMVLREGKKMKHKLKQIVIPFHKVPRKLLNFTDIKKQLKKFGWREFKFKGKTAGFWSPYYGSNRHVAVVEAKINEKGEVEKIEKFLFDQMERADGPLEKPFSHATPNAMVVVVEESEKGILLVHSVDEWRPFIYNHKTGKKGVFVTGSVGKWAAKNNEDPAKTALDGLASDMGIEIESASFKEIGIHTPNRAWNETCSVVYVAKFKRKAKKVVKNKNIHDIVKKGKVYPLADFPVGPDALVNSALWMVAKHFGCISSKPHKKLR